MLQQFFLLIMGHAVADFALQSDWMAKAKNRNGWIEPTHMDDYVMWAYVLTAHALHAAAVYVITGRMDLALLEFVIRWIVDFGKCEGWFGFQVDQWLHIFAKMLYLFL